MVESWLDFGNLEGLHLMQPFHKSPPRPLTQLLTENGLGAYALLAEAKTLE